MGGPRGVDTGRASSRRRKCLRPGCVEKTRWSVTCALEKALTTWTAVRACVCELPRPPRSQIWGLSGGSGLGDQ